MPANPRQIMLSFGLVSPMLLAFLVSILAPISVFAETSEACRYEIEASICWTNSKDFERSALEPGYRRTCLKGGREKFRGPVLDIYDRLPPAFQEVVCGVDTIYIEQNIEAVAYAGINGGRSAIGFRQSVIESAISIEDLYSWKEQLIFKKNTPFYKWNPELPRYVTSGEILPNSGLLFVLIHELSHLVDLQSGIQARWNVNEWEDGRHRFSRGTQSVWSYRGSISFYGKDTSSIYPAFAPNFYEALRGSSFISAYAMTNSFEDFAETMAYLVMMEYYGVDIRIMIGDQTVFDARSQLASPKMKWKADFIRRLF